MSEQNQTDKAIKGYKVIVIVLAVILAALAVLYFMQVNSLRENRAELTEQRDTLYNKLSDMIVGYDNLKTENDTMNSMLSQERAKADSLLGRLKDERNLSASKIRKYEKELGTLRMVMQSYVHKIDSLNTLNQTLVKENVAFRKNESTLRLRAESAEERAQELDVKVRKGAAILARDISLTALNSSNKEVTRASRATGLRTDFVLTANELAQPGNKNIFVRITGPDGYLLSGGAANLFDFEGQKLAYSASREVDYQNKDLSVNIFYNGAITGGKYTVSIYMEGVLVGSNEIILK